MQILRVISLLMNYPSAELQEGRDELNTAISAAKEIPPSSRDQLKALVNELCDADLMDVQAIYGSLFDRGRSLSLLLFEHVHGESRDRGQAMVDLMGQYQVAGFEIDVKELPDYIPLYLEYLSTREDIDARVGLADVSEILGVLSARLQERDSKYHSLFDALLIVGGAEVAMGELLETAKNEERDDTPEAIDKLWEEEAITFSNPADGGASCGLDNPSAAKTIPANAEKPVQWVDVKQFVDGAGNQGASAN